MLTSFIKTGAALAAASLLLPTATLAQEAYRLPPQELVDIVDAPLSPWTSLSPARDALLKKGLIYSGERGRIAFTVPHFGRYLRAQA